MNPIGVSTWIWVSPFTNDDAAVLASRARDIGADLLEIAVEDIEAVTADELRLVGEQTGISFSVCGAFGEARDLSHEDEHSRRMAEGYIKSCIDLAEAIGATNFVGPMYSAVGKARMLGADERKRQRCWAIEGLKVLADYAAERHVRLAIEPLKRFETDLINTTEQALELCDLVDRDNVGLNLDTFHMNIEEKSLAAAIRNAGDRLLHFQVCENDRGTPGTGHIPWGDVFNALGDIRYGGPLVIESFTPSAKEIAKAVSLWRPLDASGDELAEGGVRFLRDRLGASAPASEL